MYFTNILEDFEPKRVIIVVKINLTDMIVQANATGVGLQADAASVGIQANATVVELTQASAPAGYGGRCSSGWNASKCDSGSAGTPSFGHFSHWWKKG